jgi:transposase
MNLFNYSLQEIEVKYKAEDDVRVRERLQLLLHLQEGCTQREVAQMIRVSKDKVPFWKGRFESGGFEGLYDKGGRGRKAELTEEELSMLASAIADGYLMKNGYTRPYKTKDVVKFISENFYIQYTVRHVRRILQMINFSLQVPRPRHKKRNHEDVDQFKKESKKNKKG